METLCFNTWTQIYYGIFYKIHFTSHLIDCIKQSDFVFHHKKYKLIKLVEMWRMEFFYYSTRALKCS